MVKKICKYIDDMYIVNIKLNINIKIQFISYITI